MASTKVGRFSIDLITKRWLELQSMSDVFAYKLNVRKHKYLLGNFFIYVEYNPERSKLRRSPQVIESLNPEFNDEQFNFNKINPKECIASISFNDINVDFIINRSPLTKYHTLICPDLKGRHSQRVTLNSLRFSIRMLMQLNDKGFRIGYNSPGALASVNHLHFHLLFLDVDLYIDRASIEPLGKKDIYRLSKNMPTEAICWYMLKNECEEDSNKKLIEIYEFLMWLCTRNRPHNLFITQSRNYNNENLIKIFIFVRENHNNFKDLQNFNIGFCELAGYVTVGQQEIYDNLTEECVIKRIRDETGCVYNEVYSYFENGCSH